MSYSGDAAEQVVKMGLEGVEVAARISGAGAMQIAKLLYAVLKEQNRTKGKTRLVNMLRSGKELKVFAVKDADLQRFCKEAKKYGVLYCVLKDRDATDGITDIMVRAEDASKIGRIFERFQLSSVDMGSIRQEIERSRAERSVENGPAAEQPAPTPAGAVPEQDTDAFLDMLFQPAPALEDGEGKNPTEAGTVKSPQSEPISEHKAPTDKGTSDDMPVPARASVRKELAEIRDGQKQKAAGDMSRGMTPAVHIEPPRKKPKPKIKTGKER